MKRPNILVFMTDQQNGGTVLPGNPWKAVTPVLDDFRGDAVSFSRAYCPAPHCCPSRATFFTGLMPSQHGVWNNVNVANALSRGFRAGVNPWSVDLAEAGYGLHFAGKWHVSNSQEPRDFRWEHVHPDRMCHGTGLSPEEQDREARDREVAALRAGTVDGPPVTRRPGEIQRRGFPPYVHYGGVEDAWLQRYFRDGDPEDPFGDTTVVAAAEERLRDLLGGSDPWCLFVGTLGPHDPYIPPARFLDLYPPGSLSLPESFSDPMDDKPALYRRTREAFAQLSPAEHLQALRHYLAFCSYEDELFGRLLACLREAGAYDDTLVVYLSDHGDYAGDHGLWCKGLPSFLSAYHIPAIVKLPGTDGPRGLERRELVSLADFGPTFLQAAGLPAVSGDAGRSLLPLLDGAGPVPWRDALFFQTNGNETYGIQRSVLTDRWRFVYNGFDYDELYDLAADPGQMHNLAGDPQFRPVVEDCYRRLWDFALRHGDTLTNDYIFTALADVGPGIALPPGES